jgi:hypothetical protein
MAHNRLMNESLANRDKKWTTSVNGIYDSFSSSNVDDFLSIEITKKTIEISDFARMDVYINVPSSEDDY